MQSQISGQAHCSLFVFTCFYLNLCFCFYSDILTQDPLYSRLYAEEHEIEGKDFPAVDVDFLQKAEKWQKMCVSDEAKTFLPEFLDRFH